MNVIKDLSRVEGFFIFSIFMLLGAVMIFGLENSNFNLYDQ